ncbi:unnamed protein product [Paramecium sonneborni]|uniref:WD40-repeat-containing domain n=1 Tax=Paramecium sonneborni TaxID=65129 RepID=A0A8S1PYR4_9CILI|nr:unnamed protein product [Paramecium sonneborni]
MNKFSRQLQQELEILQIQNQEILQILNQFFEETANKFQLLKNQFTQTYNRKQQLNVKLENFISNQTIDIFEQLFQEIELLNYNKDLTFQIKVTNSNDISLMQEKIQELQQIKPLNNQLLNHFNQYQEGIKILLNNCLEKKEIKGHENQMNLEITVQSISQQNLSSKTQGMVNQIQLSQNSQEEQNQQDQFVQQTNQIKEQNQSPLNDIDYQLIFTQLEIQGQNKSSQTLQECLQIKKQEINSNQQIQQTTLHIEQYSSMNETYENEVLPLTLNELKLQILPIKDYKEIRFVVPIQKDIYLFTTSKEFFIVDLIKQKKSQIEKLEKKISSVENIFQNNLSNLIFATKDGKVHCYEYNKIQHKIKFVRSLNLSNKNGRLLIKKIENKLVTIGGENRFKIYSYPNFTLVQEINITKSKAPKFLLVNDQEVFIAGNNLVAIMNSKNQIQYLDDMPEKPKCLDFKNRLLLIVYSQKIMIYEKKQNMYAFRWIYTFIEKEIQICKFMTFSPLLFINVKQKQGYEQSSAQIYEDKLEMEKIDTKDISVLAIENLENQFIIIALQHDSNNFLQIKLIKE